MAVLFVVGYHLLELFGLAEIHHFDHRLGEWGVFLFFVHTSLVLMLSLERQTAFHYRFPILTFIVRRLFRIYPLSLLAVAIVCVLHLPIGDTIQRHFVSATFDFKTEASNFLLIQNLTNSQSVMAPLWTLPYEMQMFLVLPLLFQVAKRSRGIGPLLVLWVIAALIGRIYLRQSEDHLIVYAPCFISGVIGYKLLKMPRLGWPFQGWLFVLLGTTLLLLARDTFKAGWVCCLIVGVMAPQFRELGPGLLQRASQVVARYSYGIYLSHYPFMWLAFEKLRGVPLALRWAVFLVCATAAPVILYHAVEAPMIGFGS